jgi:hypothetical protein
MLSGALGAVIAVIAFTTVVRLGRWQPWAQAAVGGGLYIAALFFADWITCVIGPVTVALAMLEIDAIESEDDHARHRGWRQPATRPGRGLRLVYSAPRSRGAQNAGPEGQNLMKPRPEPLRAATRETGYRTAESLSIAYRRPWRAYTLQIAYAMALRLENLLEHRRLLGSGHFDRREKPEE